MNLLDCLPSFHRVTSAPRSSSAAHVDLLLLGSGWTSTFVLPLAAEAGLSTAFTTRAGGGGSIKFDFDPKEDDNVEAFRSLPDATTVLIIFPVYEEGGIERLVRGYLQSRDETDVDRYYDDEKRAKTRDLDTNFVLLGSTGIYDNGPTFAPHEDLLLSHHKKKKHHKHHDKKPKNPCPDKPSSPWIDESSPYSPLPRAISEEKLLALSKPNNAVRAKPISTAVLLLCGLWGHGRSVRRYLSRLPGDKNVVREMGSVHFVHGRDVGRACVAMAKDFDIAAGKRWILTNQRIYDLWDLSSRFGSSGEEGRNHPPTGPLPGIVAELMDETGVKALPRSAEEMHTLNGSKTLDGRAFWKAFGLTPDSPWVD